MKKVGGGYVFFHRMLLEHFAEIDRLPRTSVSVTPELNSQSVIKANVLTNVHSSNTAPQLSNSVQNIIVCSNCSHNNPTDGKFCTKCGRQLIKNP